MSSENFQLAFFGLPWLALNCSPNTCLYVICYIIHSIIGGRPLLIIGVAKPTVLTYTFLFDITKDRKDLRKSSSWQGQEAGEILLWPPMPWKILYRAPWDLLLGTFRKGAMTVAGDATHVMDPFLGQGGAAGLEDAIVMARRLVKELSMEPNGKQLAPRAGMALDRYIKERRMRALRLSR